MPWSVAGKLQLAESPITINRPTNNDCTNECPDEYFEPFVCIFHIRKFQNGRQFGFYFFLAKNGPVVMGVSVSGFERLDRLSLPRRARRCADDAVITPAAGIAARAGSAVPTGMTQRRFRRLVKSRTAAAAWS